MKDHLQKEVLALLRENARMSNEKMAELLNVSIEEIEKIVAELERKKVIVCYTALTNPERDGSSQTTCLVEVKVTPQRGVGFDEIARRVYRYPEVKTCYLVSGTFDLLLEVEGESLKDIANFVAQKLATLDHVLSTTSHFILKKYKHNGIVTTDDEDPPQRMPISP